jgi:hypothetical protein
MRVFRFCLAVLLIFGHLALAGCSGDKKAEEPKKAEKNQSDKTAEAIKDFAKRPMDKARATQQMGDERTDAIDEALKQK